jgi:hypothetical protein
MYLDWVVRGRLGRKDMEDARAYAAAANEWAELVREIGTARLDAQDAADAAIAESYTKAAGLRKAIAE